MTFNNNYMPQGIQFRCLFVGGPVYGSLLGEKPDGLLYAYSGKALGRLESGRTSVPFLGCGSSLSSEVVVCGHCLVTLSLAVINETIKRLSSLPV